MTSVDWTEDELDRWFREEFAGSPEAAAHPLRTVYERFGVDTDADWPESLPPPELVADDADFLLAWQAMRSLSGASSLAPMTGRDGSRPWDDLSPDAKAALRRAHDRYETLLTTDTPPPPLYPEEPDSITDELTGTSTGGRRLVLPLVVGAVVLLVVVVVGSGAFRDDGTVTDAPTAGDAPDDEDAAADDDGDGGEPTSDLPPARPATDEPVTVAFTGDDPCGAGAGLTALGINIAPRPGPQGGEIAFFGPAGPDPFALTGTLLPGPDGPVWEDRGDDLQAFTDVTVADGTIAGALAWTDESGCASTIELSIGVPDEVTTWWGLLPPSAPADVAFSGSLTVEGGTATLLGTLTDSAGAPVEGQALTVQVYGEDGLGEAIETFSGPGGLVELTFPAPDGDVFSVSVVVAKGAHAIGNVFATAGG